MISVLVLALAPQDAPQAPPRRVERYVDLNIDEAVRKALANNLPLASSALAVEVAEAGVDVALGAFEPVAFANPRVARSEAPTASSLAGAQNLVIDTQHLDAGIRQVLPTGGSYTLTFQADYTKTNNQFTTLNPNTTTSFFAEFNQPLLRGAWTGYGRIPQYKAETTVDQTSANLRQLRVTTIQAVHNGYWDLTFTIADRDVKRRSLALAERFLEINQKKVDEGLMAEVEIYQAQTDVAARREELLTAENLVRAAEDSLKQLLFPFDERDEWNFRIRPTSSPPAVKSILIPSWEASVGIAYDQRPDLHTLRLQVRQRELDLEARRSELLPLVSFIATGRSQALAAQLQNTFADLYAIRFPGYTGALAIEIPLGNLTARSREREAELLVAVARQDVRALEITIAREVRDAIRQLIYGEEKVAASRRSREYAEKQYQAEQLRFDQGLSTNFEVISLQRDFIVALTNEQLAILNYAKAGVALERAQGTLAPR
jgi:outer membrane protein TolC